MVGMLGEEIVMFGDKIGRGVFIAAAPPDSGLTAAFSAGSAALGLVEMMRVYSLSPCEIDGGGSSSWPGRRNRRVAFLTPRCPTADLPTLALPLDTGLTGGCSDGARRKLVSCERAWSTLGSISIDGSEGGSAGSVGFGKGLLKIPVNPSG